MDEQFYPSDQIVPESLVTEECVLVPLQPAHVHIDYDAVVNSREMLHTWAGGSWPREGFTLEENLEDLQWHDQEHRDRIAFTYTILDPSRERCLGCLYMRPLSDLKEANPGIVEDALADEAIARFWVRSSLLGTDFDRRLLKKLCAWFNRDWPFPGLYLHTRKVNLQQVELFDSAELEKVWSLQYSERGGTHEFYRAVPA